MFSVIELLKHLEGEEIIKAVFSTVKELSNGTAEYLTHKVYGHKEVMAKLDDLKKNNIEVDDFVIITKNKAIFDAYNESSDSLYVDSINIGFWSCPDYL